MNKFKRTLMLAVMTAVVGQNVNCMQDAKDVVAPTMWERVKSTPGSVWSGIRSFSPSDTASSVKGAVVSGAFACKENAGTELGGYWSGIKTGAGYVGSAFAATPGIMAAYPLATTAIVGTLGTIAYKKLLSENSKDRVKSALGFTAKHGAKTGAELYAYSVGGPLAGIATATALNSGIVGKSAELAKNCAGKCVPTCFRKAKNSDTSETPEVSVAPVASVSTEEFSVPANFMEAKKMIENASDKQACLRFVLESKTFSESQRSVLARVANQ